MKPEHGSVVSTANLRIVPALRQSYGLCTKASPSSFKKVSTVIIETDATEVVKLLEEGPGEHHLLRGHVEDAQIIFNGCQCTVLHIYREGNLCADAMAKLGAEQPEDILVVNDPPAEIRELLVFDMVGLARERD